MNNTETIIKELEDAITEATYPDRPRKFMMSLELAEKVLALLKWQRPRVMTLKDVRNIHNETDVWIERRFISRQGSYVYAITGFAERNGDGEYLYAIGVTQSWDKYSFNDYGTNWRVWTSRPTDEQRQSEKWN